MNLTVTGRILEALEAFRIEIPALNENLNKCAYYAAF